MIIISFHFPSKYVPENVYISKDQGLHCVEQSDDPIGHNTDTAHFDEEILVVRGSFIALSGFVGGYGVQSDCGYITLLVGKYCTSMWGEYVKYQTSY